MDIHTPKGRERIVRQVLSGQTPKAAHHSPQKSPIGCPQIAYLVQHRRSIGLEDRRSRSHRLRPRSGAEVVREDRATAPPALDRQVDRGRGRRRFRHCQLGSASTGLEPGCALSSRRQVAAIGVTIRANSSMSISRSSGGSVPSAIGSLGRQTVPGQSLPGYWLGVRPCLHRPFITPRLSRGDEGREETRRRLP